MAAERDLGGGDADRHAIAIDAGHERLDAIVRRLRGGPAARLKQRFGARQLLWRPTRASRSTSCLSSASAGAIRLRRRRDSRSTRAAGPRPIASASPARSAARPSRSHATCGCASFFATSAFVDGDRALVVLLRFADLGETKRRILRQVPVDLPRRQIARTRGRLPRSDRASSAPGRCSSARSRQPGSSTARRRSRSGNAAAGRSSSSSRRTPRTKLVIAAAGLALCAGTSHIDDRSFGTGGCAVGDSFAGVTTPARPGRRVGRPTARRRPGASRPARSPEPSSERNLLNDLLNHRQIRFPNSVASPPASVRISSW